MICVSVSANRIHVLCHRKRRHMLTLRDYCTLEQETESGARCPVLASAAQRRMCCGSCCEICYRGELHHDQKNTQSVDAVGVRGMRGGLCVT